MFWETLQQWLAGTRLFRCLAGALFGGRARRHVAALAHQDGARCQARTLRDLVHRAQATRFGRAHDFRRIRTPADFRRLVPLRTPLDFWRDHWQPAFPEVAGLTWPGPIAALIARPGEVPPYVPAPPALWHSHGAAALSALSFVAAARPHARLLAGRFLVVSEGPAVSLLPQGVETGALEWLALEHLPPRLRPYTVAPPLCEGPGCSPEGRLRNLVRRSVRTPITCIAGEADVLARFFALCKSETGWRRVADVWPDLAAVLYQRQPGGWGREQLAAEVGEPRSGVPVLFLEACVRPEGAIAVEDPRHGCLRLLPNHGVYFEFVPPDELGRPRPIRHGLGEVEVGVPYLLALSSPAGVWACLAGTRVCFERRDPPLLRVLEAAGAETVSSLVNGLAAASPPAGHPRNGDSREERSGMSGRIPWSARAGQG